MFYWLNQTTGNFEFFKEQVNLVPEFLEVMRTEGLGPLAMRWVAAMYDSRSPYYHLEEKKRMEQTCKDIFKRKTLPFDVQPGSVMRAACDKYMGLYLDTDLEQYRVYEVTCNKMTERMGQLDPAVPAEREEIESIAKSLANLNKQRNAIHAILLQRASQGDLGKPQFTTKAGKALTFMEKVHGGQINPADYVEQ